MEAEWIRDGRIRYKAVLLNNLTDDEEALHSLSDILMGKHVHSRLLRKVRPGTFSEKIGAKKRIPFAFRFVPSGGFGVGGVYAVQNWVTEKLDPIMPNGWGAAMSEPILFPSNLPNGNRVHVGFFAAVDRKISPYTGVCL